MFYVFRSSIYTYIIIYTIISFTDSFSKKFKALNIEIIIYNTHNDDFHTHINTYLYTYTKVYKLIIVYTISTFTGSFNEKLNAFNIETIINKTHNDDIKFVIMTVKNSITGNINNEYCIPIFLIKNENPNIEIINETTLVSCPK
jgi:hypothetical protein